MKKLYFIAFYLICTNITAQNFEPQPYQKPVLSGEFAKLSIEPSKNSLSSSVGSISLSEKKDNVIGSPYLSESFILARVNNGEQLFKLRYNNFSDFVEYEKSKDQVLILNKEKNTLIEFTNGKKLFLKEFQKGKNIENGYFENVVNGNKISVYKKQKINLIDGNKNNNGYNQISQSEYKLEKEKFFIELSEILYPIETTRDIIKFFPNQQKDLKKYLKNNKISFESITDIKKLTVYIDEIH